MGSKSISQDEKFAFAVVETVLGVHVEPKDVDGAPGMIDAELQYKDGRTAALEVSSIGPSAEAQIAATLNGKQRRTVPGLMLSWHVSVPRNFAPRQLNKIGPALLRCEELQATRLEHAEGDPVVDELLDLEVRAWSYTDGDPVVWIHLDVLGGFTTAGMSNLDVELSSVLQSDTMRSKIDKLAKAQYDEQHLFLHVRPTALSFPIFEALSFGGQLPDTIPQLPGGLDQVWLVSGWKAGGVVRAIAHQGWLRSNPFD